MNNTNTHEYMQSAVNVMFMQMHSKERIKLFVEMFIATMIKEFKQLHEGAMSVKPVVILLNPD